MTENKADDGPQPPVSAEAVRDDVVELASIFIDDILQAVSRYAERAHKQWAREEMAGQEERKTPETEDGTDEEKEASP